MYVVIINTILPEITPSTIDIKVWLIFSNSTVKNTLAIFKVSRSIFDKSILPNPAMTPESESYTRHVNTDIPISGITVND